MFEGLDWEIDVVLISRVVRRLVGGMDLLAVQEVVDRIIPRTVGVGGNVVTQEVLEQVLEHLCLLTGLSGEMFYSSGVYELEPCILQY